MVWGRGVPMPLVGWKSRNAWREGRRVVFMRLEVELKREGYVERLEEVNFY
jgi:hypothetical protein